MYITIYDIIGKKTIDLSYLINPRKEITVISMFNDNFQYKITEPRTIIYNISGNKKKTDLK